MRKKPFSSARSTHGSNTKRTDMSAALYALELQRRTLVRRQKLMQHSLKQIDEQLTDIDQQIAQLHQRYTQTVDPEEFVSSSPNEPFQLEY